MKPIRDWYFPAVFQNIVAVGAGVVTGLGFGDNTKAAVIRLGIMEMVKFVEYFTGSKWNKFSYTN